nr:hypothetical protein [Enterobacter asburiae]
MSTAASFQDETTSSATISFSSPSGPLTLKITPRSDLTSGIVEGGKRLASVSVKSSDNTQKLGVRWSPSNTNQVIDNYAVKVTNENGHILFARLNDGGLIQTPVGNDSYFVNLNGGAIATDIVTQEGSQEIMPGNYVVTLDASSYIA